MALESKEEEMAVEANERQVMEEHVLAAEPESPDRSDDKNVEMQRLDCIYDDEPLDFEKYPMAPKKMQPQDPLEEINRGEDGSKRPTYISTNIDQNLKSKVISLLKEFKDCFSWDYNEMHGLSRDLVELKLPIKAEKKPVKQTPRHFAPAIMSKIKEEIERLLRSKFIRPARYVDWLANIVPVIKKSGTLRVCIDFGDLNAATPKDNIPCLL